MKKFLLVTVLCLATSLSINAQMSDSQIIEFVQKEQKAGTSQSQIVTKLMQRGVKIDHIRRLRNKYYSKHVVKPGVSRQIDDAVLFAEVVYIASSAICSMRTGSSPLNW